MPRGGTRQDTAIHTRPAAPVGETLVIEEAAGVVYLNQACASVPRPRVKCVGMGSGEASTGDQGRAKTFCVLGIDLLLACSRDTRLRTCVKWQRWELVRPGLYPSAAGASAVGGGSVAES